MTKENRNGPPFTENGGRMEHPFVELEALVKEASAGSFGLLLPPATIEEKAWKMFCLANELMFAVGSGIVLRLSTEEAPNEPSQFAGVPYESVRATSTAGPEEEAVPDDREVATSLKTSLRRYGLTNGAAAGC